MSVMGDTAAHQLKLTAERVSMRDVVKSFAVKYEHAGARSWPGHGMQGLARRSVLDLDFSPTINPRLALFPPDRLTHDGIAEDVVR